MFTKSVAAVACLASLAQSQTSQIDTYTKNTVSLKTSPESTTSAGYLISSVINGADSATELNQDMTFTMGAEAWSGKTGEMAQYIVCQPKEQDEDGTTTMWFCNGFLVSNPGSETDA